MASHLSLKHIRLVLEVARTGSVTAAAESLGLSQPALSRNIAEVEEALGTTLFERLPRGIRLTRAGGRLVAGAGRILGDLDDLMASVRGAEDALQGRLRIGFSGVGYISDLMPALSAFAQSSPAAGLEATQVAPSSMWSKLNSGELELVVAEEHELRLWPSLTVTRICRLDFGVVVRAGHPLALQETTPTEADAFRFPVIAGRGSDPVSSHLARRFENRFGESRPQYVVEGWRAIQPLLLVTDAIYPRWASDFSDVDERFVVLRNCIPWTPYNIAMGRLARSGSNPLVDEFEAIVLATFAAEARATAAKGA